MKSIASALAFYMHNEENKFGIHVSNAKGDHWLMYGDKSYFKESSSFHRHIIHRALQASADQVFYAYLTGKAYASKAVSSLIPYPDEVKNQGTVDIAPLFYWDEQQKSLLRRSTMSLYYDREWTTDWTGLGTLIELRRERGMDRFAQAVLARSELAEQAVQYGLIEEPSLVAFVRRK